MHGDEIVPRVRGIALLLSVIPRDAGHQRILSPVGKTPAMRRRKSLRTSLVTMYTQR